jgi:hypothetical protein
VNETLRGFDSRRLHSPTDAALRVLSCRACPEEVLSTLTDAVIAATVLFVPATVDAFLDEYIQRYIEGDVRGVTNLCHVPFLAVRRGEAIHMSDRGAVWDHFASAINAYRRAAGVETWKRLETDTRQLGEHSVLASVHWNALDANDRVVRDTWTSYQPLPRRRVGAYSPTRITSELPSLACRGLGKD